MMSLHEIKLAVISATGLSRDALDVYLGLTVFVVVAVVFGKSLRSIVPWLAVLGVAGLVELVDIQNDLARYGHWRWSVSLRDSLNMLFWPTVLLFVAQRRFTSGN